MSEEKSADYMKGWIAGWDEAIESTDGHTYWDDGWDKREEYVEALEKLGITLEEEE